MDNRFLIVEDDLEMAALLREALQPMGREIDHASDGKEGLRLAKTQPYELLILDINLPGMSGIEICRELRTTNRLLPILMLTASKDDLDKIISLERGADDYLTKPFNVRELLARIGAILRRSRITSERAAAVAEDSEQPVTIGELRLLPVRREAFLKGKKLELTAMEFDLLIMLAANPGRVFSREELMNILWGYVAESSADTVTAHLCRLRAKIEDNRDAPKYLLTVRGAGYRFVAPDEL